ncbi:uncharacterized protein LOC130665085 [Microplitis mediator]|uniref:uncharacterized protein LOC130665085 n=1 Tax=Microplitis mediator TaxID=375433 RepID=UPI002556E1E3|nr:uncharacterized protein LOC130665085 [Microplitis mediator]
MLFIRELLIVIVTIGGSVRNLNASNGKFENSANGTKCAEKGKICSDDNQCCSKFCEMINGTQICGSSLDLIIELSKPREIKNVAPIEDCTPNNELALNCTDCCSQYCHYLSVRNFTLTFCHTHPYAQEGTQSYKRTDDPESFWGRS